MLFGEHPGYIHATSINVYNTFSLKQERERERERERKKERDRTRERYSCVGVESYHIKSMQNASMISAKTYLCLKDILVVQFVSCVSY